MKNTFVFSLVVALLLSTTGCITHFKVVKVTACNRTKVKGERVKLPVPFIVGTPTPDGTIKYAVQYFPDPDQEYAIQTWSFMAKQKTDIGRTVEMYVSKLTLAQDSATVATQLSASSGAVAKGGVDTLVAKEETKATAEQTAAKAKSDNIKTKQADVAAKSATLEKQIAAVDSAQKTLDTLTSVNPQDPAAIKAAQTALTAATLTQKQAQIDLDFANSALVKAANADLAVSSDLPKAKGIVIYRILEDKSQGIKLVPVRFKLFSLDGNLVAKDIPQLDFETAGTKSKGPTSRMEAGKDTLNFDRALPSTLHQDIQFNTDIKEIDPTTTLKDASGNTPAKVIEWKRSGSNSISLIVPPDMPIGTYKLQLKVGFVDELAGNYPITIKVK